MKKLAYEKALAELVKFSADTTLATNDESDPDVDFAGDWDFDL